MKNVTAFQKSIYGLEDANFYHIDPEKYPE
jgi:hypothetical protein